MGTLAAVKTGHTLNPAQQDVLDQLGAGRDGRPTFHRSLLEELRTELDDGLKPIVDQLGPPESRDILVVTKHLLTLAMGCERHFLATEDEPFTWSVPTARGSVVHKAIELSIHWKSDPMPLTLVDKALTRLSLTDSSLADWLHTCTDVEKAELRAEANDQTAKFLEGWPRLKKVWWPVTEARLRSTHQSVIVLSGRVDLTLGRSQGDRAGKVLIDLKTGGFSPSHLEDLRFYALIETLRTGIPPRRLATNYLDEGRFLAEDVTTSLLHSSVARVIDGVARIVKTRRREHEPATAPGPPCRWCPVRADCQPGQNYLDGDSKDSISVDDD